MIADDMIIAGKDEAEHDETLRKVMKRAKDKNIKFNKDKIQLKVREVKVHGKHHQCGWNEARSGENKGSTENICSNRQSWTWEQ